MKFRTRKKVYRMAAIILLAAIFFGGFPNVTAKAYEQELEGEIVFLYTSDFADKALGDKIIKARDLLEAKGAYPIIVDLGNFSDAEGNVEKMNEAGFKAVTLGCDDLKDGYDAMMEIEKNSDFDVLAANMTFEGENPLSARTIIEVADKKVGLIGVVTPSAQEELGGIGIIGGDDLVKCIQDEVNALKDESVDTIAVLSSLGVTDDSLANILSQVDGIDVVLDGQATIVELAAALEDVDFQAYVWGVSDSPEFIGAITTAGLPIDIDEMLASEDVMKEADEQELVTEVEETEEENDTQEPVAEDEVTGEENDTQESVAEVEETEEAVQSVDESVSEVSDKIIMDEKSVADAVDAVAKELGLDESVKNAIVNELSKQLPIDEKAIEGVVEDVARELNINPNDFDMENLSNVEETLQSMGECLEEVAQQLPEPDAQEIGAALDAIVEEVVANEGTISEEDIAYYLDELNAVSDQINEVVENLPEEEQKALDDAMESAAKTVEDSLPYLIDGELSDEDIAKIVDSAVAEFESNVSGEDISKAAETLADEIAAMIEKEIENITPEQIAEVEDYANSIAQYVEEQVGEITPEDEEAVRELVAGLIQLAQDSGVMITEEAGIIEKYADKGSTTIVEESEETEEVAEKVTEPEEEVAEETAEEESEEVIADADAQESDAEVEEAEEENKEEIAEAEETKEEVAEPEETEEEVAEPEKAKEEVKEEAAATEQESKVQVTSDAGKVQKDKTSTIEAGSSYTVVKGDCLWKIAQRAYGDGSRWIEIYNANAGQISNPNLIFPGQTFVIPAA